jgi:hypothetical protein
MTKLLFRSVVSVSVASVKNAIGRVVYVQHFNLAELPETAIYDEW